MATFHPSPITLSKSSQGRSLQNTTFQSHSGLSDTLHSTQSLSGRSSIMTYNNKQYPSASVALAAYISDFEGAHPLSKTYHRTVEDLLTPRSVLLRTVDRSLDTGVRDTRSEWRRYISKKLLDESYSEMVQADVEMEQAQALVESSQFLTADLSPLPGSSVITEVESQASASTDALLLAPPYPPLKHPVSPTSKESIPVWSNTLRREPSSGNGNLKRQLYQQRSGQHSYKSHVQSVRDGTEGGSARTSHVSAKYRMYSPLVPKFQSNISPVKKLMSTTSTWDKSSHSDENVKFTWTHLKSDNLQLKSNPGNEKDGERLSLRRKGQNVSVAPSLSNHTIPRIKSTSEILSQKSPLAQNPQTDGRRPPPSWIQDLDVSGVSELTSGKNPGGRAPPSWIGDLNASGLSTLTSRSHPGGRAPPSWIQDLEVSGVSSAVKSRVLDQADSGRPHPGGRAPPSWIQDLDVSGISNTVKSEAVEQAQHGRSPPSWIQDLNSTLTSGKHRGIITSKPLATRPLSRTGLTTPGTDILRRSNSANDLLTSETYDVTGLSMKTKLPGLTFRDFDFSESFLRSDGPRRYLEDSERFRGAQASSRGDHHSKKAVKFTGASTPKKTSSFTTDDLVLASPTGKDFHLPGQHSRGQKSEHYLVNRNGYNHSHLASQRVFGSARGVSTLTKPSRGGTTGLLSSTPKHFESNFISQSLNGYVDNERSSSWSRGGYVEDHHNGKTKRMRGEDDRLRDEALLERAQKVLDAARASRSKPSHSLHHHHEDADRRDDADRREDADRHDNSLLTEEILEGDRPWERNLPLHKPLHSSADDEQGTLGHQDIVTQFLDDCLRSASENQKLTGGSQPGPVEALKNMLFTLQGIAPTVPTTADSSLLASHTCKEERQTIPLPLIETSSSTSSSSGSKDEPRLKNPERLVLDRDTTSSSGSGTNFDEVPGGKSLQRAMEHLSRLKVLVSGGSHPSSEPSSTNAQVVSN